MGFFDRQTATPAGQHGQMTEEQMRQAFLRDAQGLKNDVSGYISRAHVDIPENLRNDPRAMAMHLIQSGQVPQQRLRLVQPLIDHMMGHR